MSRKPPLFPVDSIEVRADDNVSFSAKVERHVRNTLAAEAWDDTMHNAQKDQKPITYSALQARTPTHRRVSRTRWLQVDDSGRVCVLDALWAYVPFWKLFKKRR